ncbi:MAG: GNAT family N-acetyltransferase [Chloroflexi bacterium]|nr:GNAT family N-acetyltransferase [Chloroflexota bacterium]
MLRIVQAENAEDVAAARDLFVAYADALGISLCFQGFERELAGMPGAYGPPSGRPLLARCEAQVAGCVALRDLDGVTCEMKRLYVCPAFRGRGIGRALADAIVDQARQLGYRAMRLDTLRTMPEDIALYRALGFVEIAPYCHNPIPGALFFERWLVDDGRPS